MAKLLKLATLSFFLTAPCVSQTVTSFPIIPNDLELTRLAQPLQYFDKIGKRAGIMGYESGTFEMWVWPWKPLRNFELSFLLGTATQPILAKDIARTIAVTPEATVLTYTYESFTVREIMVVPRDEPGVILLLDVYSTTPLTIVAGFLPVMQPMWPAGIGGQFSYWDDDTHAYVISEGQWRGIFLCGSPLAQQMAAPPAHMFADNPLQFKIDIKPSETAGKFIPIVIAGSPVKSKMDSVKATFNRLWNNAESYYRENYTYYRNLRNSTVQVITPNKEFNLAYEWGKVALDNLMITNPTLGTGMVAGFGLSGGGVRPGFAWFFGGDAFINSLAMNSYGDYSKVRDALAFTQKWQRQEDVPIRKKNPTDPPKDIGKMAHELSQSDGICDWWNDYHYGYNHADTTPWYIVAMGDYVRASGDIEFLKKSWPSVKQAYKWCLSKDSDGDGLMDLKGAGLGALEFGKLVGIYADVYTCGVWVQALKELTFLAAYVDDREVAKSAGDQARRARESLEKKFWIEDLGLYSYGATEKGEQVSEKTPWPGVAMMFDLLDNKRTRQCLRTLGGGDMCTEWGVRSLARSSSLFEPTNYNYGAVWPFVASFFNTAQFNHGFSLAAYQTLTANVHHATDNALGVVPEVFSGELNQKLGEAYHHQGFSTTGYLLPFVRGLLGLEVNALNGRIKLAPRLPADWDRITIRNIAIGKSNYDFGIAQTDSSITVTMLEEGDAILPDSTTRLIEYDPELPTGAQWKESLWNGRPVIGGKDIGLRKGETFTRLFTRVPVLLAPAAILDPGSSNRGLRFIWSREQNAKLVYVVEGLGGASYSIPVLRSELIASVTGGTLDGSNVRVLFDGNDKQQFVRKEIIITRK